MKILKGPYGPYIKKGKQNTKIPSSYDETTIKSLTQKQCEEIIQKSKKTKTIQETMESKTKIICHISFK